MSLISVDSFKEGLGNKQLISFNSKDIVTLSKLIVTNEKNKNSRILYCGPNFSSSGIVLFRILELSRGSNYLEKVVFDSKLQSIQSSLYYLDRICFDRYVDPKHIEINNEYLKSNNTLSSTSYYRGTENGHIRTNLIVDEEKKHTVASLSNFYTYWKIRSYYRK